MSHTVVDFIDVIAAERGFSIEIESDANVQADRILLQRAITNLLTNAIRHASANSTVQIKLSRQAATVSLAVENGGANIPRKM